MQQKTEDQAQPRTWYKLDNAAKIYPAIKNASWNSLFRLSVTLCQPVDADRLQRALEMTLPRFPNAGFRLRAGFFWYYFDTNKALPQVQPDVSNPCVRIKFKNNRGFLFRVRYYRNRIAVEFFHSMTDGTGGMYFLKTLTAQYLKLGGEDIPVGDGVLDCTQQPLSEELEDGYKRFADLTRAGKRSEAKAWHIGGTKLTEHMLRLTTGVLPADKTTQAAKRYGVSVTELLTAVYIHAIHQYQQETDPGAKKPIKISVPVNMRNFYPTRTLLNFALFVNVGIDPSYGRFELEEIIREVHHQLRRGLNKKYLNAMMAANVSSEKNILLRMCPLFIKNIGMLMAYNVWGERQFTSTLSNLGVIRLPEQMQQHISRFDFLLGQPRMKGVNCAVASYQNITTVSLTSNIVQPDIEREFFRCLVEMGVPVKVESNY